MTARDTVTVSAARGRRDATVVAIAFIPLVLFALLSASLHVGVFAAIRARGSHPPTVPAFDPASQTLAGETLDVEPPG